ncbi:MAG: hypothetical protein ABJH05_14275 [Fulvivirga sp.]
MKHYLLLSFFSFILTISYGQKLYNDPYTYPGAVILNDSSVLHCNLKYSQKNENLICMTSTENIEYSAQDVIYFQFYDAKKELNRYFFSLKTEKMDMQFFELLVSGEIKLFVKAYLAGGFIEQNQTITTFHIDGKQVVYHLFYDNKGVVHRLNNFSEEILPMMQNRVSDISSYIVSNKLKLSEQKHQLALVKYYNNLVQ